MRAAKQIYPPNPRAPIRGTTGDFTESVIAESMDVNGEPVLTTRLNDIGQPGQMGFGVGVCPESDATLLQDYGITPMDGCKILGHDNYGNYMTASGSVVVWIPKCYLRMNHPDNPTFAKMATMIAITGITQANPSVLSIAAHGIPSDATNCRILIRGVGGMVEVNDTIFTCTYVDANTVNIGIDTTGYTAYTSGGYAYIFRDDIDIKGVYDFTSTAAALADGYGLHRAFIDGGEEKEGFFRDKYVNSKLAWGTGTVSASIKNGNPISTVPDHNPIADLTACSVNQYYEAINAAHARDGVNGTVNANSKWFCSSVFIEDLLAKIALAHGQASNGTANCAWYHATYNYPKGNNNNALKDYDDTTVIFQSDGYSNASKAGSGALFAKTTHNGQNCGICDLNGNMYRIAIGLTCEATSPAIEGMSQENPCVITVTGHGLTTGDFIQVNSIAQADWSGCKDKIWQVTVIDPNSFNIAFNASAFGTPYDAGTDPGTITKGTFYVAKESTAMKDFTSGYASATDHWGAIGIAAMMETISIPFKSGSGFAIRYGNGNTQVFSEAISGSDFLAACSTLPVSGGCLSATGVNLFGNDYFYQYIRNQLCVLCGGRWHDGSVAGVFCRYWGYGRAYSGASVGFACACYL